MEHFVSQVEIDGDSVVAVCACGERSETRETEADAREDLAAHIEESG